MLLTLNRKVLLSLRQMSVQNRAAKGAKNRILYANPRTQKTICTHSRGAVEIETVSCNWAESIYPLYKYSHEERFR